MPVIRRVPSTPEEVGAAPAAHGHAQAAVTGLVDALAGKQASGDYATSTALTNGLAGKAASAHSHAQGDVTGLTDALAGKQAAGDYATSTALTNGLAGKADTSHTQAQSTITGLVDALGNKIESSQKGAANGLATLDSAGLVPLSQLPTVVGDLDGGSF